MKVSQLCLLVIDSLKILDNIGVIIRTKKYDTDTSLSFLSRTSPLLQQRASLT